MSEPKYHVGQKVLEYRRGSVLPNITEVVRLLGYINEDEIFTHPSTGVELLWNEEGDFAYETGATYDIAERHLFPIADPDTDHTTTDELERTA